jgi:hypothetical protein
MPHTALEQSVKTKLSTFATVFAGLAFAASAYAAPAQYVGNSHWYEFIAGNFTWAQAFADAGTKQFNGMTGYLATVTSSGENDFIAGVNPSLGWLGGSDNVPKSMTGHGAPVRKPVRRSPSRHGGRANRTTAAMARTTSRPTGVQPVGGTTMAALPMPLR